MSDKEDQSPRRPADPFPSFAALRARHSELLEIDPEIDGQEGYLEDVEHFLDQVQATGAILSADEERRASQSILNYWTTVLYRADRKPSNTILAELDPTLRPRLYDDVCPYPGVREFNETEAKYFFGRLRTIDYLIARLKEENYLALVGPSGSGKSSLVRAGLLPAIKSVGLEEDSDVVQRHFFPIITPGSNPLISLASMLSKPGDPPSGGAEAHSKKIREDSKHLLNFLTQNIAKPAVIVVDQVEELFTLCKDGDARQMFVNNLLALENTKHKVILCSTLEDFDHGSKRLAAFQKIYERGRALLPRLGGTELSDAIVRPADLVGLKFKDQTIKQIVQEIGTLPVALPLLQFTLSKLWEKRGTHDEYFATTGGCRQILTQSAEEFMLELDPEDRTLAEQIFRSMITFEYRIQAKFTPVVLEPHAVPVRFEDLSDFAPPEQVRMMLNRMSSAQLIRRSASSIPQDEQIELVHESLIQTWPRLSKSVERRKRKRFEIVTLTFLVAIILFGVFAGVTANYGYNLWQNKNAHENAQKLAVAGRKNLNDRRFDLALLLSLAAYVTDPLEDNLDARSALLTSLLFRPHPKTFIAQQGLGDLTFSPDGQLLAANDVDGKITFWKINNGSPVIDGEPIRDVLTQGDQIAPIIFSNDKQWLASGGHGAVTLWNVAPPRQQKTVLPAPEAGRISVIALSHDNQRLAALGDGESGQGVVVMWDTASENKLPVTIKAPVNTTTIAPVKLTTIALSNNGEILAAGDNYGTVQLVDLTRKRSLKPLRTCPCLQKLADTNNVISSIAFSPDDKYVAVSGTEETMLWSVTSGEEPKRLSLSHGGVGMILSFSEDGNTLAGFEGDKQLYLWDMGTLQPIGPGLFRPIDSTASLAFSRDCKTLASRGERGITLWDLSGVHRPLSGHEKKITDLAFSPDGRFLVSAGDDGFVKLWNSSTGESTETLPNDDLSSAISLAFSQNGKFLAAGLLNGTILLKSFDNNQTVRFESADQQHQGTDVLLDQSALAFTPDNQTLVSLAVRANYLQIERWNVTGKNREGGPDNIGLSEGTSVTAIALSPDGKYLAVVTDKKDLKLWDIGQKRTTPIDVQKNGTGMIGALRFSPNGGSLYFGDTEKSAVSRYDVEAKKVDTVYTSDLSGEIFDVALSSDEKTLAIAMNPDQTPYPTGNEWETAVLILVDIGSRQPRVIGESARDQRLSISSLAFSKQGALAAASRDFTVLLWDLNVCQAQRRVCSIINRPFTPEEKNQYSIEKVDDACKVKPVERKECQ